MGRTASILSLPSALFLCFALFAQDAGSIEGTVVDSATGIGIADVRVYFGAESGTHYDAVTGPSGKFQIAGVKDGEYGSHFTKDGSVPQYSVTEGSTLEELKVRAGQDPVQVRVEMVPYARLTGRVLDPDGKPVPNANVNFAFQDETTDDQGRFAFTDVVPGVYVLKATPDASSRSHTPQRANEDRIESVPTWYPPTPEIGLAETITVRSGADLSGYEIHLQTSPVYRVRGTVIGVDGKPASHMTVRNAPATDLHMMFAMMPGVLPGKAQQGGALGCFGLFPTPAQFPEDFRNVSGDGSFEFASVPRGLRYFSVLAEPLPLVIVSAAVDRDIDDLQIRLTAPIAVDGTVELAGTAAGRTPNAVRKASVSIIGPGQMRAAKRSGDSFHIENVGPGDLLIAPAPGLAGGYYLDSVSVGGRDATWKTVRPGRSISGTGARARAAPRDLSKSKALRRVRTTSSRSIGSVLKFFPARP